MQTENLDPLSLLAIKFGTDKWGGHFYTQHYHRHFQHLRSSPVNVLEIGIGGHEDPKKGGESLRMWEEYFPNGRIYGIDIADKSAHDSDRIKTFKGSQTDLKFLGDVLDHIGKVDIIVDDGSHENDHIITSFKYLFPRLGEHGIYVVEDLQTSYWEKFGGSSFGLDRSKTAVNFFKSMTDCLNHKEIINPRYVPSVFDKHIVGMAWYHGMVFIQKGWNDEESNRVVNNRYLGQAESVLGYYRRKLQALVCGIIPPRW